MTRSEKCRGRQGYQIQNRPAYFRSINLIMRCIFVRRFHYPLKLCHQGCLSSRLHHLPLHGPSQAKLAPSDPKVHGSMVTSTRNRSLFLPASLSILARIESSLRCPNLPSKYAANLSLKGMASFSVVKINTK